MEKKVRIAGLSLIAIFLGFALSISLFLYLSNPLENTILLAPSDLNNTCVWNCTNFSDGSVDCISNNTGFVKSTSFNNKTDENKVIITFSDNSQVVINTTVFSSQGSSLSNGMLTFTDSIGRKYSSIVFAHRELGEDKMYFANGANRSIITKEGEPIHRGDYAIVRWGDLGNRIIKLQEIEGVRPSGEIDIGTSKIYLMDLSSGYVENEVSFHYSDLLTGKNQVTLGGLADNYFMLVNQTTPYDSYRASYVIFTWGTNSNYNNTGTDTDEPLINLSIGKWLKINKIDEIPTITIGDSSSQIIVKTIMRNGNVGLMPPQFSDSLLPSACTTCTPNWTAQSTGCRADDTNITYYVSTNNCVDATIPANITNYCDYNQNGVIGNISTVDKNFNISIYVGGSALDLTKKYNETRTIEIKDGSTTRISLSQNLSANPLNLKNLIIKRQSSDYKFGYLIVQNLEGTKTFIVDKLNSSSDSVCIKNSNSVDTIGDISSKCTNSNEVELSCPDEDDGYECEISDGKFVVSGLTHSGVREILPYSSSTTCTPNWGCTAYSACTNGNKTRVCSDSNLCGTTTGKPAEREACSSQTTPTTCTPKWTCTGYSECKDGEQTRVCTDKNLCSASTGKPIESRTCKDDNTTFIVMIVILSILILTIIGVIIYILLKPSKDENSGWKPAQPSYPSYPGYSQNQQYQQQTIQNQQQRMQSSQVAKYPQNQQRQTQNNVQNKLQSNPSVNVSTKYKRPF